jgi:hypothetical protein
MSSSALYLPVQYSVMVNTNALLGAQGVGAVTNQAKQAYLRESLP